MQETSQKIIPASTLKVYIYCQGDTKTCSACILAEWLHGANWPVPSPEPSLAENVSCI